jgi:hypothetical protein
VKHTITVARTCTIEAVDFQVLCTSGLVEIGNSARFFGLMGVTVATCAAVFLHEIFLNVRPYVEIQHSFFLYSAAKNEFIRDDWDYRNIYYLDKASALLTGLITLDIADCIYIFDTKTWRFHTIPREKANDPDFPPHCANCIPLAT